MLPNISQGKLPQSLKFVNMLPGTELEVHTNTSHDAAALRLMLKNVRVLTLP